MSNNQLVGATGMKWTKRPEFSFGRMMVLTLAFTNLYFVSFFFARLLRWV